MVDFFGDLNEDVERIQETIEGLDLEFSRKSCLSVHALLFAKKNDLKKSQRFWVLSVIDNCD